MKFRVCFAVKSSFTAIALRPVFATNPELRLLGEARDCAAIETLLRQESDCVAVIDIELLQDPEGPQLERFLTLRREPTLIVSSRGQPLPAALATKPAVRLLAGRRPGEMDLAYIKDELPKAVQAIREAWLHGADAVHRTAAAVGASLPPQSLPSPKAKPAAVELVVVGVSTGGPPLLMQILKRITHPAVPFLIAQHMPHGQTAEFAQRLTEETGHRVVEVGVGSIPEAGTIGMVQGGRDFELTRLASGQMRLREAVLPENPFHPSIDHLLLTAARVGIATHSVILTGMGQDGSKGALELMRQGYPVVAQRPDTCAVAGMPQSAIQNGAAREVQTPEQIIDTLNRWLTSPERARRTAPAP